MKKIDVNDYSFAHLTLILLLHYLVKQPVSVVYQCPWSSSARGLPVSVIFPVSVIYQCPWSSSSRGLPVPVVFQCPWSSSTRGLPMPVVYQCPWSSSARGLPVPVVFQCPAHNQARAKTWPDHRISTKLNQSLTSVELPGKDWGGNPPPGRVC